MSDFFGFGMKFDCSDRIRLLDRDEAGRIGRKWFPYNKGGEFRRWYGNDDYVVNWENDGEAIATSESLRQAHRVHELQTDYFFEPGITWSDIQSCDIAFELLAHGFIFDTKGSCAFPSTITDDATVSRLSESACRQCLLEAAQPNYAFSSWRHCNGFRIHESTILSCAVVTC